MASILDRAKANLVVRHPFFASILMRRPLIADESVGTAAVNQRGEIFYAPSWVETLTMEEALGLLAHEVMHVVGQHVSRTFDRDPVKMNIAADAWINDLLTAEGFELPKGGVNMPGSKDDTVDNIYNNLPPDMKQMMQKAFGQGAGGKGGDGDDPMKGRGIGQDLKPDGKQLSPAEQSAVNAELKVAIAQAAQAAKMQGKLSAALGSLVASIIETKTPWYDILERYMVARVKCDSTWARKNRRFKDFYLPSRGSSPAMGTVVIQIDVSGSISKNELDHYNGHMQRIMELCRPQAIHVLYVDTQVLRHDVFGPDDEFNLDFYSGGGTDMERGLDYIEDQGIDAEVAVVLTDGYTGFTQPPATPVVWVCSTNQAIPYGEVVRFDPNDK